MKTHTRLTWMLLLFPATESQQRTAIADLGRTARKKNLDSGFHVQSRIILVLEGEHSQQNTYVKKYFFFKCEFRSYRTVNYSTVVRVCTNVSTYVQWRPDIWHTVTVVVRNNLEFWLHVEPQCSTVSNRKICQLWPAYCVPCSVNNVLVK